MASEPVVNDRGLRPSSPIGALKGIGPARAAKFKRLGIDSLADLLRHLPMRYELEAARGAISDLQDGVVCTACGTIQDRRVSGFGKGRRFECTLQDDSGTLMLTFFRAGYLTNTLHVGHELRVQGKVKLFNGYPQMVNPKWWFINQTTDEADGDDAGKLEVDQGSDSVGDPGAPAEEDRLRPIYPATEGLASEAIEAAVAQALDTVAVQLPEPLPDDLRRASAMPLLADALRMVHQPKDNDEPLAGRRRMAYNELLLLQLGVAMKRAEVAATQIAPELPCDEKLDAEVCARFPFTLTDAQRRVIDEVTLDLAKPRPMNRLVQGDVGAGKTVIALHAMLLAVADGHQAALMAPTELLAEQHFRSIQAMLAGTNARIELVTGRTKSGKEGQRLLEAVKAGRVDLVIGTHALLFDVPFKSLAVVVVDEQHRFGVEQRAALKTGGDEADEQGRKRVPHVLVMTATPIPRSLSLTVFGDLDVSIINELPPGRTPPVTRVVDPLKSADVYGYAKQRVEQGEQVYVVVPAVESEANADTGKTLKAVHTHAESLRNGPLAGCTIAEVHGQMKPDERERAMRDFRDNTAHVLVATTVIEVGVDVPNATIMIIEHAERFGLAQLHQLRGRIGRGISKNKPVCALIAQPVTEDSNLRLDAIAGTTDGFEIAELDLQIRGMGDFFGTRQSGGASFRVARLPDDLELVRLARRDAQKLTADDPFLEREEHRRLRDILQQYHGEALGLIDVG